MAGRAVLRAVSARSPPIRSTASNASSAAHNSHAALGTVQQNPACCRHNAYGDRRHRADNALDASRQELAEASGLFDLANTGSTICLRSR